MLKSINEIASIVGADRATVKRRADQFGLAGQEGEKNSVCYDTRILLQLVPAPSRNGDTGEGVTLEEARIRQTVADARVKEFAAAKAEGLLADIDELLAAQNSIFDVVIGQVKASSMTEDEKEDCLSAMAKQAEFWLEV